MFGFFLEDADKKRGLFHVFFNEKRPMIMTAIVIAPITDWTPRGITPPPGDSAVSLVSGGATNGGVVVKGSLPDEISLVGAIIGGSSFWDDVPLPASRVMLEKQYMSSLS
jgi:hypothetical protein